MGYKNLFYIVSSAYDYIGNLLANPASKLIHNPCSCNHHDQITIVGRFSLVVVSAQSGLKGPTKFVLLLGVPFCDRVLVVNIGRPLGQ